MKRFLLFVVMCVCVSIGAWAQDDPYSISCSGGVATVSINESGSFANEFGNNNEWKLSNVNGWNSSTTLMLSGSPNSADYAVFASYSQQANFTRVDLSQVTSTDAPSVKPNDATKQIILPAGMSVSSVQGLNNYDYAIVNSTPLEVIVKNSSSNWAVDPYVTAATDIIATDADGNELDTTTDPISTLIANGKTVNGENNKPLENLTINTSETPDVQAQINSHLENYRIDKLTINGEMNDLLALNGVKVRSLDLSGVTNADLSGLKLPVIKDETAAILLPGKVTYSSGAITIGDGDGKVSLDNLVAEMTALNDAEKPITSVQFPEGSSFSSGTLTTVSSDYKNVIAAAQKGKLNVNRVEFPNGAYWQDGVLTFPDADSEADMKNIVEALESADFPVNSVALSSGTTWSGGTVTLNGSDELPAMKAKFEAAGLYVDGVVFSNGTRFENGKLTTVAADEAGPDGPLKSKADEIRNVFGENSITSLLMSDHTEWNKGTVTAADGVDHTALLNNAGFTVSSNVTYDFCGSYVTEKGGVVTLTVPVGQTYEDIKNYLTDDEKNKLRNASSLKLVGKFAQDFTGSGLKDLMKGDLETLDLSEAIIPTDMTLINMSFREKLKNLTLPTGGYFTTIPSGFCNGCKALTSITIPSQVTTIGSNAFVDCLAMKTLDWGDDSHLEVIEPNAFERAGIEGRLAFPNSLKRIESAAFKSCKEITSLVINEGSNMEYIGKDAFLMDVGADIKLKDIYIYADKEIECDGYAWDFYMTDGQTVMATVATRLHYPPNRYYWYVGDWKSQVNGGRIEGHDDLLALRNAVDYGVASNGVKVTPKGQIGWQKFVSSGIPVTAEFDWRTYSDIVPLLVPADNDDPKKKIADVYIVCNYIEDPNGTNHQAVLKQMKPGDVIPAGTGLVIHHYVTDQQYGGLLMFPHVNPKDLKPEDTKAYRFVSEGDKRGEAGRSLWDMEKYEFAKAMNYVGIETRNYIPTGETLPSEYADGYPNYLEAIHCMGVKRAIFNAENGNYTNYNTLLMEKYAGQKVTYRNFFFGNGTKLNASMNAGKIGTGDSWDADTDGNRGWGFFRCISKMYAINSKAFLHFPATLYTKPHGGSMNATQGDGVTVTAKDMGMFLIGYNFEDVVDYGIATEINDMNSKVANYDDSYYTLQGLKVNTPTKSGIYIHNGKKVVIK